MKKDLPMPIVIAVIVVVVVLVAGLYMVLGNRRTVTEIPALPTPTDGSLTIPPANQQGGVPTPTLPNAPAPGN